MKCCLCDKEIIGYGNNPYPLNKREGARCCDDCNGKVIIARIEEMGIVFMREEYATKELSK